MRRAEARPTPVALPQGVRLLERGWLSSNSVVLLDAHDAVVVDSGYATHAPQTVALVRQAIGERRLSRLLNTHLHSDHCGGNAALQAAFSGARTSIPPGLADAVAVWDENRLSYAATGQSCPRFGFEDVLQPGTTVDLAGRAWEVLAAPGHDPDSVMLFEPGHRLLISADALWERGFGIVFPALDDETAGFDEVEATLDVIASLNPQVVLPGHGSAFEGVTSSLEFARSKLAAFRNDPRKHAAHAMKVLLKFKLLEWQEVELSSLHAWCDETAYFRDVHGHWFPGIALRTWVDSLLAGLVTSEAARVDGTLVLDR